MFFMFSDILLYTCKGVTHTNQFRVRGQIPLDAVTLDNDCPQLHGLYSFAVITEEEEMLLAANSEEEKYKWMEDLKRAVKQAKDRESCGGCSQKRPQLANRTPKFGAEIQLMEIPHTLKLGQLERSYLSSLLWKLWEEQAEMVQMTKLIPALFRVWTKDMRTRIQCQRGEFAGIETRVSVCRSVLYQFGTNFRWPAYR
ncbi:FERM, ARHGEF and pleckstrin domain-containing protein 2-like isoform X3 [Acropora muricata]|uniref:FERM, ARHGEF and pleckstrin domain-containing protein 2-like isoform X3 n=1 Tax=Acropora muricata TaxID=159855 RepID=UPI0034E49AD0